MQDSTEKPRYVLCHLDMMSGKQREEVTSLLPSVMGNFCNVETHPESPKHKETGESIPSPSQGMANLPVRYKN